MSWSFRIALWIAVPLAVGGLGDRATACELCRRMGSPLYHAVELERGVRLVGQAEEAIGGDDPADALYVPDDPDGGHLQFVTGGGKWPQPGGKGTDVYVTYSYNNLLDGGLKDHNGVSLPVELIRGSIEEALGLWASVAPLHFIEVEDQGGPVSYGTSYPDGQFGQIRFSHRFINGPDPPPPADPIAKAQAYYPNVSLQNLAGDVFFDEGDPWQEVGTQSEPDVLGAAIHEIGHTLGLAHSQTDQANMFWIFTRYSGLGTGKLYQDDIDGIQTIYGAGMGSVTPLSRSTPEPASGALLLIAAFALGLCQRLARSSRSQSLLVSL